MLKKLLFLLIPLTFLFTQSDWSLNFERISFTEGDIINMEPIEIIQNDGIEYTISFWFITSGVDDIQYIISDFHNSYSPFKHSIFMDADGKIWAGQDANTAISELGYDDGVPHHLVFTVKGLPNNEPVRLYIDGELVDEVGGWGDVTTYYPQLTLDIGGLGGYITGDGITEYSSYFSGNLDDIKIWWRQLSGDDVLDLYNGTYCDDCEGGFAHHWDFNEGEGNYIVDEMCIDWDPDNPIDELGWYDGVWQDYCIVGEISGNNWYWSCDLEIDCAGECGGDAVEDCFGDCNGEAEIDECGECGGDGIADGECDCDGNVLDDCGICGGDNWCVGCTDETACNYSDVADEDDGSCEYETCYNPAGYIAYNNTQNLGKGPMLSCEYDSSTDSYVNVSGPRATCYFVFSNPDSEFYIEGTSIDDWLAYDCGEIGQWSLYECQVKDFEILGCMDENACNYNPYATEDNNSCDYDCEEPEPEVYGCTYEDAINYDENATVDDGSCEFEDPMAGDLNGDGIINILDAVQLIQVILDFFIDDSDIKNK